MRNDRTPTGFMALGALLAAGCSERPKPAPAAPPPPPPSAYAYVTNEDSHDLTIIDADNDSAIGTIPVGTRPRGVKVSHDGKVVFVALSGSPKCPPTMPDEECEKLGSDKSKDGVAVVDAATQDGERGCCPVAPTPRHSTFRPTTRGSTSRTRTRAWHPSWTSRRGKMLATVPIGKEPEGVTLAPDGKTVWVSGETDHDLTILDAETGKKVGEVMVGLRPRGIAFLPDGSRAYSTNEAGGTVSVVDVDDAEGDRHHHDAEGSEADGRSWRRPTESGST